mmetsp:Transcript_10341/g.32006  ORF Transcript_10341/g.32006 Transcript_10341/m.32006 type:complete len:217 (+) Transcript_10341:127-777(+)
MHQHLHTRDRLRAAEAGGLQDSRTGAVLRRSTDSPAQRHRCKRPRLAPGAGTVSLAKARPSQRERIRRCASWPVAAGPPHPPPPVAPRVVPSPPPEELGRRCRRGMAHQADETIQAPGVPVRGHRPHRARRKPRGSSAARIWTQDRDRVTPTARMPAVPALALSLQRFRRVPTVAAGNRTHAAARSEGTLLRLHAETGTAAGGSQRTQPCRPQDLS